MNKLEKLYNEDFLLEYFFKAIGELKEKYSELGENITSYLDKLVTLKKITQVQLDAVVSICDTILKRYKDDILCLNIKGIAYYYLENLVQALKNINESLKIDKEQFLAYYINVNLLFEKQSLNLALRFIDKAISINKDCISCYILKGIILHHKDNFSEALAYFEKALKMHGSNISAMNHKALELFRLNRIREALTLCNDVLSVSPDNLFTLINRGLILAKNQEYEAAIESFNAYATKRKDIRILTHLKNCYEKLGSSSKVSEYTREIKKLVARKKSLNKSEQNNEQ